MKNKNITKLFHPVLKNLFLNYLIDIDNKQYNNGFIKLKEISEFILIDNYNKHVLCDCIINISKKYILVNILMNYYYNNSIYIFDDFKYSFDNSSGEYSPNSNYLTFDRKSRSYDIITHNNVICIMMDVANSTQFVNEGEDYIKIAKMYKHIYKAAKDIINKNFYPYAYIHETCGDSLFILVNANFMRKNEESCATIVLELASKILMSINGWLKIKSNILYLRCGISMGRITSTNFQNNNVRVFGSVVNKSSRLESICKDKEIVIDDIVYNKLIDEKTLT